MGWHSGCQQYHFRRDPEPRMVFEGPVKGPGEAASSMVEVHVYESQWKYFEPENHPDDLEDRHG
ncbi:hypothetical protein AGABI1DRAFT_112401 [Agaricus bisporus var. burnettii JB137-S8]|uniref:Uncharacterized protein n=1 Tax=Agaricus bisporus var. burnettii (strain JB137-S8 / ATCC MYA-4627 / FGSC 10392) TaxID=597362 RepID=K5XBJ2_AGABU|nr:uncharacterized protein AGABI1DRAFT_112401 [Agaricus bisporus var. burnettii JB137-S8]EKM80648.1 hypothetical protein AGABI1DRAFT_112401 [Agaricus bisporus var. burnettii JB137-S8]